MGIMKIFGNSTVKSEVGVKSTSADTAIGTNSEFVGNITFSKNLQISGTVKGNINASEEGDGKIVIDSKGIVEGDIVAPIILLQGEVNGNVRATSKIEIDATALVTGNVYYDILDMHGGATVNGSLIRNKGKTAGLLEKQSTSNTNKDAKTAPSYIKSADSNNSKSNCFSR